MANILNRNQTFPTNGIVDATGLHNLIDTALVNSAIIKNQQEVTTIGTADLLLIAPINDSSSLPPRKVTVQNLVEDAFTAGTFTSLTLSGGLTYGSSTGSNTVSTNATISTATISNLTAGTTTATAATITNLTAGTTTSTAGNITNGTVQTLTASTANISQGSASLTQGTIATLNSTTGTIGNFSTTLVGDLTISTGSATVGTRVAVVNTAQEYTAAHNFNATTLVSGNSIAWNLQTNQVTRLVLSTNGTMADATNKVDGATYILLVTQGTGSNTLDWNATYKWPNGTKPTLTTGSAKSDIFTFISDGTSLFGATSKNYS
jgi:hypothetical protein